MANETIELLKSYDPSKLRFPASFQEKLDGVPAKLFKKGGQMYAVTRQGEEIKSIKHLLNEAHMLVHEGGFIVGELYVPATADKAGLAFKEISGLARQHKSAPELRLYIFDADVAGNPTLSYEVRRNQVKNLLPALRERLGRSDEDMYIRLIPEVIVDNADAVEEAFTALMFANPTAEGAVLHSVWKEWNPGKRCWGTQRMKPVPTIDLKVVGFECAESSKTGELLPMIGRINVEFTRLHQGTPRMAHIGIGPGSLSHAERMAIYRSPRKYIGRIAEVRYMRDDTYEALRQPTFLRWRDDKTKPNQNA